MSNTTAGEIRPGLFVRKTTGLVREVNRWDALILNLFWINLPLGAFVIVLAPSIWPGVDLVTGLLLTTAILAVPILMYGFLASAMPRAGGEYVYISRIIHPAVGFVVNLALTLVLIMVAGMYAGWMSVVGVSPVFATLGSVLNNPDLTNLSITVSSKPWEFGIGAATILLLGVLNLFGWRAILPIMRVVVVLMLVSFLIMIVLMVTTDNAAFAQRFAHYASYSGVIDAAKANGFAVGSGSDFSKVLAFLPLGFTLLGLAQFPAYAGGEIKTPARSMSFAMVGGLVFAGVVAALLAGLAYHTFSSDFIGSMTYLSFNDAKDYPAGLPAPFLFLYVAMLTDSVPILIVLSIGWLVAIFAGMFVLWIASTRNLLAYSLDRILPDWLAEVSPTFHTPTRINALITLLAIGILALFVWGPVSLFAIQFSGALLQALAYAVVSIAAILFAVRAKELFEGSPFNQRVGGIPVIALLGVGGLIQYLYFAYILFTVSAIGANIPSGLTAVAIIVLVGIPIYIAAYVVQRSRGVDITMAFRELPPE